MTLRQVAGRPTDEDDAVLAVEALGLATVRLHTASAASDATVPGLTAEAAALLRDRLTAAGQARLAGL